jgi:putative transposase
LGVLGCSSRLMLGEPSINGETAFERPPRTHVSNDRGERVVAAVGEGASCRTVASRFGVATRGEVVAAGPADRVGGAGEDGRAPPGDPRALPRVHLSALRERPETTLFEMRDLLLAEHGVPVSHGTVWRFLRAERRVMKKACWLAGLSGPTLRAAASAGSITRAGSILAAWCSSTRPGRGPTWRPCLVGTEGGAALPQGALLQPQYHDRPRQAAS